jgi:hypothetical protein
MRVYLQGLLLIWKINLYLFLINMIGKIVVVMFIIALITLFID